MKSQEVIKDILKQTGVTKAKMGKAMGYRSFRGVYVKLERPGSMVVDGAVEMLEMLGYKLVAVPKGKAVDSLTEYVIDG